MLTVRIAGFFSAEAFGQNIAVKRLETGQICPRQPHDILQSINQIMLKDLTTDHYLTLYALPLWQKTLPNPLQHGLHFPPGL